MTQWRSEFLILLSPEFVRPKAAVLKREVIKAVALFGVLPLLFSIGIRFFSPLFVSLYKKTYFRFLGYDFLTILCHDHHMGSCKWLNYVKGIQENQDSLLHWYLGYFIPFCCFLPLKQIKNSSYSLIEHRTFLFSCLWILYISVAACIYVICTFRGQINYEFGLEATMYSKFLY